MSLRLPGTSRRPTSYPDIPLMPGSNALDCDVPIEGEKETLGKLLVKRKMLDISMANRLGVGKFSGLVVLIAFIAALLIGYDLVRYLNAISRMEVVGLLIGSAELRGGEVRLLLRLLLRNPSSYNITIEGLTLDVRVDGLATMSGEARDIAIQPGSESFVNITVRSSSTSLWNLISAARERSSTIQVRVEGELKIPVEILGIFKLVSVSRKFTLTAEVKP